MRPARKSSCARISPCSIFPSCNRWPLDGGRFITLPCVVTRDPKSGKRNVGMYRMQVYDGQTTGMHWQRQKMPPSICGSICGRGRGDSASRAGAGRWPKPPGGDAA